MTKDRISPGNQIFLGIDIGSVSTEIVLLGSISQKTFFQKIAAEQAAFFYMSRNKPTSSCC